MITASHRSLFFRCKHKEVQEDFVDQRVLDHLFPEKKN